MNPGRKWSGYEESNPNDQDSGSLQEMQLILKGEACRPGIRVILGATAGGIITPYAHEEETLPGLLQCQQGVFYLTRPATAPAGGLLQDSASLRTQPVPAGGLLHNPAFFITRLATVPAGGLLQDSAFSLTRLSP